MLGFVMLIVSAVLLVPASSQAADPLLSGYGGPGGGEQVVLGSTMVGGGGSGGTGTGTAADPSQQSLRAPSSTAAATAPATRAASGGQSQGQGESATPKPHRSSSSKRSGSAAPRVPATPVATRPPGAPPVRAYPSRASDAGGLPLSGADVLLAVLGVVVLLLAGLGLRRLTQGLPDDPGSPQVSGR
jgi:hypothetical protein